MASRSREVLLCLYSALASHICSAVSSAGLPRTKEMHRHTGARLAKDQELDYGTRAPDIQGEAESWDCSAWRSRVIYVNGRA